MAVAKTSDLVIAPAKPTELSRANILPSSVPKAMTGRKFDAVRGWWWVQIFCANCGKDPTYVPEESVANGTGFAFYLCIPCAEKWCPSTEHMLIPDEVFWERVNQAMLEKEGRILAPHEIGELLKDPTHYLSKLAKDRPRRT